MAIVAGGSTDAAPAERVKGYLVVSVCEASGKNKDDIVVWDPSFVEGFVKGEETWGCVRGAARKKESGERAARRRALAALRRCMHAPGPSATALPAADPPRLDLGGHPIERGGLLGAVQVGAAPSIRPFDRADPPPPPPHPLAPFSLSTVEIRGGPRNVKATTTPQRAAVTSIAWNQDLTL